MEPFYGNDMNNYKGTKIKLQFSPSLKKISQKWAQIGLPENISIMTDHTSEQMENF